MEAIRDLLRDKLRVSLHGIREEDRMAAAWIVACGRAMAEHGEIVEYKAGVVLVEVADAMWMQQMIALRSVLQREMARIAGLPISAIHFELKKH
jgi:hypothetical protein